MNTNSNNYKAIVSIPGWAEAYNEGAGAGGVNTSQAAYAAVPLIYRAVRLRCDALASIPVSIGEGDEAKWPYKTSLRGLIWKTEASLLLSGAAYWLKLSNGFVVKDLQWINPFTMSVQWDNQSRQITFIQSMDRSGKPVNQWKQNEVVYFPEWNPDDDIGPGISAAQVALSDAKLMNYMTSFAGAFFHGGAMPQVIVGIEGGAMPDELTRFEKWMRQRMSGWRNAFKAIALSKAVTATVLTPPLEQLAMPELETKTRKAIADAFGLPQTMMEGDDNYASAGEHRDSFWQDTIKPRCAFYEEIINTQLLEKRPKCKFEIEELDVFQTDENERAASFSTYVRAGLPMALTAEMLGIELPKGWDYAKLQAIEDEKAKQAEELAKQKFDQGNSEKDDKPSGKALDLEKWQRKVLKRIKDGKPAVCEFESDSIDPALYQTIKANLESATTVTDVKSAFEEREVPGIDVTVELKRTNELLEKLTSA